MKAIKLTLNGEEIIVGSSSGLTSVYIHVAIKEMIERYLYDYDGSWDTSAGRALRLDPVEIEVTSD